MMVTVHKFVLRTHPVMIEIEFECRRLQARDGESLAATLTAHGIRGFRTTRRGAERGIFCGMGVCQDCLVEVDGRANERACMTIVDRPMVVRRESFARPLAPKSGRPIASGEIETHRPELLIIGAGPGGLSAAVSARRAGCAVTVVDERPHAGGQYFKQLSVHDAAPPDAQHREGARLIETARELGVEFEERVTVWGAFPPNEFGAVVNGRARRYLPRATIIATGAYERGWPVPGWTLPGVMTTGAAQTLWRTARRLPGRRVLIAGNGPLNLQLAAELIGGGAEVLAVVEAAAKPGPAQLPALLAMIAAAPGLVRDGLKYHAKRRSGRARMIYDAVVTGIEKTETGLRASIGKEAFDVDAVCLGYGFEPANELLRALGCTHDFDHERRQLVTRCDADGLTDRAGIYALGDCTGLGGARVAMAQGTLAGLAAAETLGYPIAGVLRELREKALAARARHRRFQQALWQIHAAPGWSAECATPETLICRCEEVSFAAVDAALGEGLESLGAVKRRTRIGMGRCQGRYCAPILDALLAERCGRPRSEFSGMAPRPPAKPVRIGDLVS
ncbi:MAG: FAD-dependent oxidoreductase [Rhizobiales bacterium]|nr:FAD-dependent oxidoreductase [Hyphomicrobiales bacterium]